MSKFAVLDDLPCPPLGDARGDNQGNLSTKQIGDPQDADETYLKQSDNGKSMH